MRINKWLAQAANISRRGADAAISSGRVTVNGQTASLGHQVTELDRIALDGRELLAPTEHQTIILNKPVDYVCSRDGQGSKTIYDLLPINLKHLKPVGRLDKDSSGLLVMTTDGQLAHELTHPKFQKDKVYEVELDKSLDKKDFQTITTTGAQLDDGPSKLTLKSLDKTGLKWQITMHEGRNRQIRRTFETLGYASRSLHRISFGAYNLKALQSGKFEIST